MFDEIQRIEWSDVTCRKDKKNRRNVSLFYFAIVAILYCIQESTRPPSLLDKICTENSKWYYHSLLTFFSVSYYRVLLFIGYNWLLYGLAHKCTFRAQVLTTNNGKLLRQNHLNKHTHSKTPNSWNHTLHLFRTHMKPIYKNWFVFKSHNFKSTAPIERKSLFLVQIKSQDSQYKTEKNHRFITTKTSGKAFLQHYSQIKL